jgi:broad specificity phosphatase PhoE
MAESFTHEVETRVDLRVAQRLRKKPPSVCPETAAVVNLDENDDTFRARVTDHVREVRGHALAKRNVWVITHQAVIEEVAAQFGV